MTQDGGTDPAATPHAGVSPRRAIVVATALLVLLALTAWTSGMDLGRFNLAAALGIAFLKAALVAVYFMDLRRESPLTWLFAGAGFFWLAIMLALTLSDTLHRAPLAFPLR